MVRSALVLLVAASAASVHGLFSVHDDLLAFPQYEVQFPPDPVSEAEASAHLAQAPTSSSFDASPTSTDEEGSSPEKAEPTYEALWLDGRRYLCSVPVVKPPPPLNATEKELSRAAEEKEVARATTRGWELLSELEGECLYFVSGWWSYSYCHNREVRQFHQKAPQGGAAIAWPPTEDPGTPSYVLGQVSPEKRARAEKQKGDKKGSTNGEGTELQATGELKFLVQKLGGGTRCDLTMKDRKIEIQFHCNSGTTDRIGWIKEVSTCCYQMVVYTPRLCNDIAFLPPREDRINGIQCREIMDEKTMEEYYINKAKVEQADALDMLREAARAALGLGADAELGVGEAVGGKKAKTGGKKAEGKKGVKEVEVGGKQVGGRKVVEKKGGKKLAQVVFVDDGIKDEAGEAEEADEDEEEWVIHQEL